MKKSGKRPVLCVAVIGSTEIGAMDPVKKMKTLLDGIHTEHSCWFHVDAAYGGFYASLENPHPSVQEMEVSDSLTLDPHKLGYVPYSAGVFLCRSSSDYYSVSTDAPYVQFEKNVDPGPFTLEGSRSATGASAVWMVEKTLGFGPQGLGRIIQRTMNVKYEMKLYVDGTNGVLASVDSGDSNIICILSPRSGEWVSETNARTLKLYQRLSEGDRPAFTISKTFIDRYRYDRLLEKTITKWGGQWDSDDRSEGLVVLRLCLMNPFTDSREMNTPFIQEFVKLLVSESKKY